MSRSITSTCYKRLLVDPNPTPAQSTHFCRLKMLASLRQKALRCMTTLPTNQMLCRTKWTEITPENKEVARRRILQKFIDAEIDFEDPDNALLVPHMGVLEERNSMMPENNAPGLEETDENELEFEMRKMGVESQVIAIDRVQKVKTSIT